MQQHSYYSMKILIILLLLAGLVVEYMVDYAALLEVPTNKKEPLPVPKVIGLVDQHLKLYDFGQYRNVVEDNIFAVNVVISQPVEKPVIPVTIPFTMQLSITGIAITPERKMVMVWDKKKKESQVLHQGESLYEWQVISIDKKEVVLENESGDRYEFELNVESSASFNN